ncbi:DinB family protein [Dongia soli]|uniref:DinB family protein n=1 Tax=Dongia soli TaxID=600628 RepID=A0ABU5EGD5_9PROT|nr:DinB family protein [Dongia soli]MDY0884508.1 DinB family protein [Dongia soli]
MPSLLNHFRAMARNNAWSNARLLDACAKLSDADFSARRISFFPSLQATLNHILIVDRNYLADMRGTGRPYFDEEILYSTMAELAPAQRETDRQLIAFCDSLGESDLERIVAIDRRDGVDYRETIGDILAHLYVHQIHHRGQAHAMLAGTDVAPPQLDEFFLASDAPQREADLQRLKIGW